MNNFYDQEDYSFEDIQLLIDTGTEESIHLEFKESGALSKNENKKKEIGKDVSSFANSDGGILIYGIIEQDHKATSISFIDGNEYSKEWLEQVINSTIQRRITDLIIFPIRQGNNIAKTIYLIKIPQSNDTPHLNIDKKFYKRFNFQSVPMEEYEIRQLYNRRVKSELFIAEWSVRYSKADHSDKKWRLTCEVSIVNTGNISEDKYKINVIFENFNKLINISFPQPHHDYTFLDNNRVKISAAGSMPIFPNETLNVARFFLEVPIQKTEEALLNVTIKVYLFYSIGEDILETNFLEAIESIKLDKSQLGPH
jgi:hypothetical protein